MPDERTATGRPPSLLAGVAGLLLAGAALAILAGNIVPTRARMAATQRALDAQNAENRRLDAERERLEREARALESDPWTIERVLRDEYRMSSSDEMIVR